MTGAGAGDAVAAPPPSALAGIRWSPARRAPASVCAPTRVAGVAWDGADESVLAEADPAGVARACAFRLLCGFQALTIGLRFSPVEVARFARVLDAVS